MYGADFYSTPEAAGPDPVCASGPLDRVIRGGYYQILAWVCRSATRGWYGPRERGNIVGFRPRAPSP